MIQHEVFGMESKHTHKIDTEIKSLSQLKL